MNVDEYIIKVIELRKAGDYAVLEDAANCVLRCSEDGCGAEVIDERIYCLDNCDSDESEDGG